MLAVSDNIPSKILNRAAWEQSTPRAGRRMFARVAMTLLLVVPVGIVATPGVAGAATRCPAFVTWQDWGGSRVHAYVDFRASDTCNGRHIRRAYVRLIRQCGPYYDTGRIYTNTASSPFDARLFSVSAWIFDSAIWSCNTNTYYGYDYF